MATITFNVSEVIAARRSKADRIDALQNAVLNPAAGVTITSDIMDAVLKSDPWVVVGTTTIDGTFEQVREAFGETWENVDHLSYALARGDQWNIGGRHLVVHSHEVFDGGVLVSFDIVRRQSEIDAEVSASWLAEGERIGREYQKAHPPKSCPECGPHGNRGRVALFDTEVACTTCAGGVPGDAFGLVGILNWTDPEPTPPRVSAQNLLGTRPSGFAVPSLAEVENYIKWCRDEQGWT